MKNQPIYLLASLLFAVWCWTCTTAGPETEAITYFVRDGEAVDVVDENKSWSSGEEGLTGENKERLTAGRCVGKGDFEMWAELRIDDISKDNASLMLDAAGPVETGELIFARNTRLMVRGFFFGDRTQKVRDLDGLIRSGEWFELKVVRRDDEVTFCIADTLVWRMHFAGDRPFGKLTFNPGQARLTVRDFGVKGATTPLSDWVPRLERDYPIAGENTVNVFERGMEGYHTYRIPAMVRTSEGTLLAFAEGRKNSAADHGNVDLVLRRSNDNGRSWERLQLVSEEGGDQKITIGNPVPVVDRQTGRIWLFFCRNNRQVFLTHSDDDGVTWHPPSDLTASLKKTDWGDWYATGPGHGIQLAGGRLIVPANHGLQEQGGTRTHMIISDDHGASWRIGGVPGNYGNETCIAQVNDNEIYVNMRSSRHNNQRPYCREVVWSRDGGDTFGAAKHDCELPGSICQGSLLAFRNGEGGKDLIFCNPASQRREQLRVRRSQDGGKSWSRGRLIYGGSAAYSDLVQIDQSRLGVLFERDLYEAITFTTVSLESL